MLLLGIHGGHNSSVCLLDLDQKKIIGNLEIERITRIKNYEGITEDQIEEVVKRFGYQINQIDAVAAGFTNPFEKERTKVRPQLIKCKKNIFGRDIDFIKIPHHFAHAASCAGVSNSRKMLIITLDGIGDDVNTCVFFYDKTSGSIDGKVYGYVRRSPACVWGAMCIFNYKTGELKGPGKLMALAAYGEKDTKAHAQLLNYFSLPSLKIGYLEPFNHGEDLSDNRSKRSQDVAAELQGYTNIYMEGLIDWAIELARKEGFQFDEIGFSGGLSLNIVATSYALKRHKLKEAVIPPFPDDSGLAFGYAMLAASNIYGININKFAADFTPYLGPLYPESRIQNSLKGLENKVTYNIIDKNRLNQIIANDLSNRKVCFHFKGSSESGPRALGNRSILYDPSDINARELLNQIKSREWYRPFAPMIIDEYAKEVLDYPIFPSIYMTTSANIRSDWCQKFVGAIHIDGSCRPQLVSKKSNSNLYEILVNFNKITGIPGVINTSFNINSPIVETPEEAIQVFLKAKILDKVLYLDNYRIILDDSL